MAISGRYTIFFCPDFSFALNLYLVMKPKKLTFLVQSIYGEAYNLGARLSLIWLITLVQL